MAFLALTFTIAFSLIARGAASPTYTARGQAVSFRLYSFQSAMIKRSMARIQTRMTCQSRRLRAP